MQTKQIPAHWRWEKQGKQIAVWDENGKARCGALLRNGARKGQACEKHPETGRYRCNIHQGYKVVGELNPSFKDGKFSRYLRYMPARLQERYQELAESGDISSLIENIALLDLRLTELMGRMDIGEFGASYTSMRSLHHQMQSYARTAFQGAEPDERRNAFAYFMDLFNQMGELITLGQKDYQTWQQVLDVSSERRQQVKTMADIEYKGENSVPITQVMGMMLQIEELFKRVNRIEGKEEREKAMGIGIHNMVNFRDAG